MAEAHIPKVAILASGGGSTAEAFIRGTQTHHVKAEVGLVISNNPPEKAGVYKRVAALNREFGLDIEVAQINGIMHPEGNLGRGQTLAESEAIAERIRQGRFDHVALMGYMKMVRGALVEEYGWKPEYTRSDMYKARMSNTHPGPLPETADTYGLHTSEKVLKLRMEMSRHTVHLVSEGIDQGPILSERDVPLLPGDTAEELFNRVQVTEKTHLQSALDWYFYEQARYERLKR